MQLTCATSLVLFTRPTFVPVIDGQLTVVKLTMFCHVHLPEMEFRVNIAVVIAMDSYT